MAKLKTHKYENIILDAIQSNPRFQGHEELLEPIYNNTLERLGNVVDSIPDETIAKEYVQKVTKLAVINTIKTYKNGSAPTTRNIQLPTLEQEQASSDELYSIFSYTPSSQNDELYVSKSDLAKIEEEIIKLNENSQNKEFLNLYSLRYTKNKSIEAISDDLNMSQAQVAERLFEISALIKRICGNEVSQV